MRQPHACSLLSCVQLVAQTLHEAPGCVQAEKEAEERASEAPEDRKEDAAEDGPSLANDVLTPGRRWGARVVLMSGANAR